MDHLTSSKPLVSFYSKKMKGIAFYLQLEKFKLKKKKINRLKFPRVSTPNS